MVEAKAIYRNLGTAAGKGVPRAEIRVRDSRTAYPESNGPEAIGRSIDPAFPFFLNRVWPYDRVNASIQFERSRPLRHKSSASNIA